MDKLLDKFINRDTGIAKTPLDINQYLSKTRGEDINQVEYARVIDNLMYLSNCTSSDIAYTVSS